MDQPTDPLHDALAQAVQHLLRKACAQSCTLATVESCTGGLLASLLTDLEGFSHAFERGFIVYSDDAKAEMVGVDRQLIRTEGAVSKAVAIAMATGGMAHGRADVVLAVTGFAGPAGPHDEPGLVHFACVRRGCDPVHREEHFGDLGRSVVRVEAVRIALAMMSDALD